jgi:ketosteroid isomerase-like protein
VADPAAVVQRLVDLAAARDYEGAAACLASDVVWFGTRGGLDEGRVMRGQEACLAYLQEVEDPWQRWDFETERLIVVGDAVVVFLRETGQARHADLEVMSETAMVMKVAGSRVAELQGYLDRQEALRAVGAAE